MHTDSGMTGISLSGFMPYMTVASLEMSDESEFCAIQPEFIVKPLFLILRNFAADFKIKNMTMKKILLMAL